MKTMLLLNLTKYAPPSDDNLTKVNGYLLSFGHLIDAKDWSRARDVIRFKLNDDNHVELCDQIAIWGEYSKALKYYEKILGKIDADTDVFCLNGMTNIYGNQNEFEEGIKYGEKALEKAKEIGNIYMAAQLAFNIAWCYNSRKKYIQATALYNESLDFARMSNNKFVEARALEGLSTVNLYLKNYDRAIYYGHASLKLAESYDNLLAKTSSFLILGISYLSKNNYEQAIQYTQEGVNLACQSSAPCNEAWGCNFEKIYFKMEKYEEAEKYLQESLDIFKELGNYRGQSA